jgi:hypothetical protein
MFSTARWGRLLRGDISHSEWMIQDVEAEISIETVLSAAGVTPLGERSMAYLPGTAAVAWPMVRA